MYHLLSGDASDSLICPVRQTTLILVVGGIVSLLLQYPINLLKGEVVSSSYEQRVRPSTCAVDSCKFSGARGKWFGEYRPDDDENLIGRLEKEGSLVGSVDESKLTTGCPSVSESSSGSMNWTILAFLTQYMTVCDDPVLMRMQLTTWGKNLAFDFIPGSHATQAVCSTLRSRGGHVDRRKHYQINGWVLEHGLLRLPHVKASLYIENFFDRDFWDQRGSPRGEIWADSALIKSKIVKAVHALQEGYLEYKMLGQRDGSGAIKPEELTVIFLAFLSTICSIVAGSLLRYALQRIIRRASY